MEVVRVWGGFVWYQVAKFVNEGSGKDMLVSRLNMERHQGSQWFGATLQTNSCCDIVHESDTAFSFQGEMNALFGHIA